MSRKHVCFASGLILSLTACQPAEGPVHADAPVETSAPESERAPAAVAREFDEATSTMIQGAAKMQASVVACDLASQAQTGEAIAKQRARYVGEGYNGGAFDRLHGVAFKETLEKFNSASTEQKTQGCKQIKDFGEQMRQMGEEVHQRMQDEH